MPLRHPLTNQSTWNAIDCAYALPLRSSPNEPQSHITATSSKMTLYPCIHLSSMLTPSHDQKKWCLFSHLLPFLSSSTSHSWNTVSLGAKAPYLPIITLHPSLGPALGVKPLPGLPPDTRSLGAIIPCSPSDSLSTLGVWVRGPWAEHCTSCESWPPNSTTLRTSDNVTFTPVRLNWKAWRLAV